MVDRGPWFEPGFLSSALASAPVAVVVTDPAGSVQYANAAFERLTGYALDELRGQSVTSLQAPDGDPALVDAVERAVAEGRPFQGELLTDRRNGTSFWSSLGLSPVRDAAGDVRAFVGVEFDVTDDVTERARSAAQSLTAEVLLGTASRLAAAVSGGDVAQALANGMIGAGAATALAVLADERNASILIRAAGWARTEAVIADAERLIGDPRELDGVDSGRIAMTRRSAAQGALRAAMERWDVERVFMEPVVAGRGVQGLLIGTRAGDEADDALVVDRVGRLAELGAVSFENVALIERIRTAAERDQLTGLLRPASIRSVLERLLEDEQATVAVLYLDVDRFKRLNDSLGHVGGDEVIAQIARRLAAVFRGPDAIGRLGGDEFMVVVPAQDESEAEGMAARIEQALREPFVARDRSVHVTASVGTEVGRRGVDESAADAAERLIRAADDAMYAAKHLKRSQRRPETELDVVRVATDLHAAVAEHRIRAAFQPQYDAQTGRLCAYEALARWTDDELGAIPPHVFIPLAEESGLIHQLGQDVLVEARAFAEAASRQQSVQLDVNLSLQQLLDPGLPGRIAAILDSSRGRRWVLTAEVAEPELAGMSEDVVRALRRLRQLDVEITIDAFGSGFTPLSLLQDLPVTAIKIDKSFVRRAGALGTGLLAAAVGLARGLGLEVMAEGVETREQLEALQRLGCDRVQGHLLAPALPAAEALGAPRTIDEALRRR